MSTKPSNSAVERAGNVLRDPRWHDDDVTERYLRAIDTLETWRQSHAPSLQATMMWLRKALAVEHLTDRTLLLRSRHKKAPSVFQKLRQRPSMRAPQMEDIAGCRVVLPALEDVRQLEARLKGGRVRKAVFERDDDYTQAQKQLRAHLSEERERDG